jgi:hypothetical protein
MHLVPLLQEGVVSFKKWIIKRSATTWVLVKYALKLCISFDCFKNARKIFSGIEVNRKLRFKRQKCQKFAPHELLLLPVPKNGAYYPFKSFALHCLEIITKSVFCLVCEYLDALMGRRYSCGHLTSMHE